MPVDINSPEGQIIRKMVPFSTMPNNVFKVICDKISLETAKSGAFLFKRGDTNKDLIYLLKGEVSLEVDKLKIEVIKTDTESARFALAHQIPRKVNAVAKGTVKYLRLNSIYITVPDPAALKKSPAAPAKVPQKKEPSRAESDQWITTLLMIPILRSLPPAMMHKIIAELEEIKYEEGEIILQQGEEGDYFYLIRSGECVVTRKSFDLTNEVKVAKLQARDTFGETALISEEPRGETITAVSKVSLLRLPKDKFLHLIKEPLLKYLEYRELESFSEQRGVLLDVRTPAEYEALHIVNAVNVPLVSLRSYLKNFTKEQTLVVTSDSVKNAELAAFILLVSNLSAKVLHGETKKAPENLLIGTAKTSGNSLFQEDAGYSILRENVEVVVNPPVKEKESLAAENARLRKKLMEYKVRLEKVELEKQELLEKYKLLFKHSERLKALVDAQAK